MNCREWSKLRVEWRFAEAERRWTRRGLRSDAVRFLLNWARLIAKGAASICCAIYDC